MDSIKVVENLRSDGVYFRAHTKHTVRVLETYDETLVAYSGVTIGMKNVSVTYRETREIFYPAKSFEKRIKDIGPFARYPLNKNENLNRKTEIFHAMNK